MHAYKGPGPSFPDRASESRPYKEAAPQSRGAARGAFHVGQHTLVPQVPHELLAGHLAGVRAPGLVEEVPHVLRAPQTLTGEGGRAWVRHEVFA